VDNNFLVENITSGSFLNQKKLVIIDLENKKSSKSKNFSESKISSEKDISSEEKDMSSEEKDMSSEKEFFLSKILDKIPENNIILFNIVNPDKRSKFYKDLVKISEVKDYSIENTSDIYKIISKKY
jgi:hypothetical protein